MDIFQWYELSRSRSGVALFPFINSLQAYINVSTRTGNGVIKWGDGLEQQFAPSRNVDATVNTPTTFVHTYSPNYTGDVQVVFKQGLKDVYSIYLKSYPGDSVKYNIQDFGSFIKQFKNLFSYRIEIYGSNCIINGNFLEIPDTVENIYSNDCSFIGDGFFGLNGIPNNSKLVNISLLGFNTLAGTFNIIGDLSKLPISLKFFKVNFTKSGSAITYTAGKVWASAFDTLSIPLSLGNFLEADALFTDMGNSITSAVGGKVISIGGWFSGTAKLNYLKSLGFTFGGLDTSTGTASSTTQKFIGDIAQIPSDVTFFKILQVASGSAITYTAGKVWASNLETLSLPLPLSHTELDNLLIDMQNSVTSVGAGTIELGGYRSPASDAAVAYLHGLGRTVNIQKQLGLSVLDSSVIFRADFQNNFDVYSNSYIGAIAGGTSNQPTFALSGRKAGEYCAVFNGSQSIKTTTNLPVNSDKVTIAFWMKTDSSVGSIITELSADINTNNTFNVYTNVGNVKNLNVTSRATDLNQSRINNSSLHGNIWNHVSVVIDRTQNAANEILIYVNGVLATFTKTASADNNGNFVNNILFIGQRGGSSLGFNGSLTRLKIYNYPFAPSEVSTLYNSEL